MDTTTTTTIDPFDKLIAESNSGMYASNVEAAMAAVREIRAEPVAPPVPSLHGPIPMSWIQAANAAGPTALRVGLALWHRARKTKSHTVTLSDRSTEWLNLTHPEIYRGTKRLREHGLIQRVGTVDKRCQFEIDRPAKNDKRPAMKKKLVGRFVRGPIPTWWTRQSFAAGKTAAAVGWALWYTAGLTRSHTVYLGAAARDEFELTSHQVTVGLAQLEQAGLIVSVHRKRGKFATVRLIVEQTRP